MSYSVDYGNNKHYHPSMETFVRLMVMGVGALFIIFVQFLFTHVLIAGEAYFVLAFFLMNIPYFLLTVCLTVYSKKWYNIATGVNVLLLMHYVPLFSENLPAVVAPMILAFLTLVVLYEYAAKRTNAKYGNALRAMAMYNR